MNRRVVVTGMGIVSPIGNSKKDFFKGLREGKNGISLIKSFDTSGHRVKLAGEVNINPADYFPASDIRKMDRFTLLGMIAAKEAYENSGINGNNTDLSRCAVIVSSGIGGLTTIVREQERGSEKGFDRVSPLFIPTSIVNMTAGRISIMCGFKGYSMAPVTACSGGTNAIGDAMRLIRHGYADAAIAGGSESSVIPLAVGGFTSMSTLHEGSDPNRASIPFDMERSGFVIGEGAGILVLEEMEHAIKRGAEIYGEIKGYGVSSDAYHITAPDPEGRGGAAAMASAIKDANLAPFDISYINAHGTSTPLNDKCETIAIKSVFGDHSRKVMISSSKSMTGHLLGAAGAVEAIACLFAVSENFVPPTINYREKDIDCDLDYVPNYGREFDVVNCLSNSLGFGGHNSSIVISKWKG